MVGSRHGNFVFGILLDLACETFLPDLNPCYYCKIVIISTVLIFIAIYTKTTLLIFVPMENMRNVIL